MKNVSEWVWNADKEGKVFPTEGRDSAKVLGGSLLGIFVKQSYCN